MNPFKQQHEMYDKAKQYMEGQRYRIDSSYQQLITHFYYRLSLPTFPLETPEEYEMVVKNNHCKIKVWEGLYEITKVYNGTRTYIMNEPLRFENAKLYAEYSDKFEYLGLSMVPCYGFHFVKNPGNSITICTGGLDYLNFDKTSYPQMKEYALKVVELLRGVNLESLGTHQLDCLPAGNPYSVLVKSTGSIIEAVQSLIEKNLLTQLPTLLLRQPRRLNATSRFTI